MSPNDEKELVEAVLRNEKIAFEKLVKQYERLIVHIIFPMVKTREDRRDLLQEIMIKIYMNLKTFGFKSKLATWIGNVTYNATVNFVRKKKLSTISPEELGLMREPSEKDLNPEEQLIASELETNLIVAIERLPAMQIMIIRLFHHDEMTLEEISQVVNLPINTVKSHLFRGRQNLKNLILM